MASILTMGSFSEVVKLASLLRWSRLVAVGAVGGAGGLPAGNPLRCRRSAVEPAPSATRATVSSNTNSHLTCVLKYQTFITLNKKSY